MIELFVIVIALWVAAITVVVLGLGRQVAMLQLAGSAGAPPRFRLDDDGPDIGAQLPTEVTPLLSRYISEPELNRGTLFVVLTGACPPCRSVATAIGDSESPPSNVVFLLSGHGRASQEIEGLLRSARATVVVDPIARQVTQLLGIGSSPFGVRVDDAKVTDKRYIRGVADYVAMTRTMHTEEVASR